ncbi:MAG TPA: O-antigen ligase family protein [Steroidobacteraceae bacterium]|jgi:O-antigen ligase|nr:O-antigen ligase family protein [Steroidobacteraceae bacterium]
MKLSVNRQGRVKTGLLEYSYWGFLLVSIGRVGQLFPGLSHIPLGKITLLICVVPLIAYWRSLPRASSRTAPLMRTMQLLLLIALLLTPFSLWKGGSFGFLLNQAPVLVVVTLLGYKICRSWQQIRGTMLTLVLCGIFLAGAALVGYNGGRAATETMYDTNDLAYLLVTVFPLALGFALTARRSRLRVVYWAVAGALVLATLLTQSRGGFLALLAELALLALVKIAPTQVKRRTPSRVAILVCAIGIGVVVWTGLPKNAQSRLDTIFSLSSDYNLDRGDVTGRREIWTRGLEATFKRPIGYGVNTFQMVDLKFGGRFMAPHNSFLEVLVELGVLGLALFVGIYLLTWRALQRLYNSLCKAQPSLGQHEQIVFVRMTQFVLIGNAVAGFFLSMAYSTLLWTLIGICIGMVLAAYPKAGCMKENVQSKFGPLLSTRVENRRLSAQRYGPRNLAKGQINL